MGLFSFFSDPRDKLQPDGQTVLITGASQGLGLAAAKLLAAKGANIAIVARTESKLVKALEEIRAAAKDPKNQRFTYFAIDVTTYENNQELLQKVTEWNKDELPDIIWACAGLAIPTLFVETDPNVLTSQMSTNYWSAANLLHGALKLWLKPVLDARFENVAPADRGKFPLSPKTRHFIFTASVAAYWGVAGYSPYSPCKAAVRSLCDSVRQETLLYEGAAKAQNITHFRPIRLHMVTPGNIETPGFANENLIKHPVTAKLEEGETARSAHDVALDAVKGLERGDYLITTSFAGQAMRASAMAGSRRNGLGIVDFVFGAVANLAASFISPDMDRTIYKWGETHGIHRETSLSKPAP